MMDDEAFITLRKFQESLRTLTVKPGEHLRCDLCGNFYKTMSSLRAHLKYKHWNCFNCKECSKKFQHVMEYVVHNRGHSGEDKFACIYCDYKAKLKADLGNHLTDAHRGPKYFCEVCDQGFSILTNFKEHANVHTGVKPFICEICGKAFIYTRYLTSHKLISHAMDEKGSSKMHECKLCKKEFKSKKYFYVHMRMHDGFTYVCDFCGKQFFHRDTLKYHLRTHTGDKPYKCKLCSKSFTRSGFLKEHVRIHTGEKPYKCEFCHKGFSQRSSMTIHTRTHTGEKPYLCRFCSKAFITKSAMDSHMKSCDG